MHGITTYHHRMKMYLRKLCAARENGNDVVLGDAILGEYGGVDLLVGVDLSETARHPHTVLYMHCV